jgi:hypothetical protein
MDPSEENISHNKSARKKRSFVFPVMLLFTLLLAGSGIVYFLNNPSEPPLTVPEQVKINKNQQARNFPVEVSKEKPPQEPVTEEIITPIAVSPPETAVPVISEAIETIEPIEATLASSGSVPAPELQNIPEQKHNVIPSERTTDPIIPTNPLPSTVCSQPEKQLDTFYTYLDHQPYMMAYSLKQSSQKHFTALIAKLLANPPKVTRESDDLYTILRNTAHFFRIAGKDNILMLRGILNSESKQLEQILADYYFLISTPECSRTKYAKNISTDDLYEYGCFFLNTMGGRLYLFRRDSLSRMVVTYYAILLVDDANNQQNNRHGINLKPAVTMLLSEMEVGGSNLKYYEKYIDKLYDLKEKYQ